MHSVKTIVMTYARKKFQLQCSSWIRESEEKLNLTNTHTEKENPAMKLLLS